MLSESLSDGCVGRCAGRCVVIGQLLRLVPGTISDMLMISVSPEDMQQQNAGHLHILSKARAMEFQSLLI